MTNNKDQDFRRRFLNINNVFSLSIWRKVMWAHTKCELYKKFRKIIDTDILQLK